MLLEMRCFLLLQIDSRAAATAVIAARTAYYPVDPYLAFHFIDPHFTPSPVSTCCLSVK